MPITPCVQAFGSRIKARLDSRHIPRAPYCRAHGILGYESTRGGVTLVGRLLECQARGDRLCIEDSSPLLSIPPEEGSGQKSGHLGTYTQKDVVDVAFSSGTNVSWPGPGSMQNLPTHRAPHNRRDAKASSQLSPGGRARHERLCRIEQLASIEHPWGLPSPSHVRAPCRGRNLSNQVAFAGKIRRDDQVMQSRCPSHRDVRATPRRDASTRLAWCAVARAGACLVK